MCGQSLSVRIGASRIPPPADRAGYDIIEDDHQGLSPTVGRRRVGRGLEK
jgi:hypothetical protein